MSSSPKEGIGFEWKPLIALFGTTFQGALAVVMISVALPAIKGALALSAQSTAWIVTGYYLPLLVFAPVAGYLADALGTRRIFLLGLLLHFIGGILAAISNSYPLLIGGRLLQGLGSAALISLSLGMISMLYPLCRRGFALSIMYLAAPTANAIGPITSVFLVEKFGWTAIFYMLAAFSVFNILIVRLLLPQLTVLKERGAFDWQGMFTLGLAISGFVILISGSEVFALHGVQRNLLVAGTGVSLMAFVYFEYHSIVPLIDPEFIRKADFSFASLSISLRMFVYGGVQFLLPLFLTEVQGRPLSQVGLVFLIQPVTQIVAIPVSGRLADRFGSRFPSAMGFLMMLASTLYAVSLGPDSSIQMVMFVLGMTIFGGAFTLVPLGKAATRSIGSERMGAASGVYNMTRFIGALLSPVVLAAVLDGMLLQQLSALEPFQRSFLLLVVLSVGALAFSLALDIQQPDRRSQTIVERRIQL